MRRSGMVAAPQQGKWLAITAGLEWAPLELLQGGIRKQSSVHSWTSNDGMDSLLSFLSTRGDAFPRIHVDL